MDEVGQYGMLVLTLEAVPSGPSALAITGTTMAGNQVFTVDMDLAEGHLSMVRAVAVQAVGWKADLRLVSADAKVLEDTGDCRLLSEVFDVQ
mmetsp:Transcript_37220/g.99296  ORF Transcript_37220/g.99296 Transcript_37220/m.99296 type:complete len:92 (-) Transcript_37220:179-454(-)